MVSVYIDQQQRLWAGTFNEGVNLYEKENNRFRHFHLNSNFNSGEEAWKRNSVFDMTDDASNDNLLWMAGNDGLYSLEKSTGKIGRYYSPAPNSAGLSIQTLWMDQPDSLWLGTYYGGLVHFNTSDKSWTYHTPKPQFWLQRDANHNIIKGIARKSDHELWISSPDVGFGIFNVQTHQFSFFRHQSDDPFSILDNSANMVYLDPEKRIWVMHPQRGVSFYNPGVQFFNFHSVDIGQCRTFIVSGIADFAYDPNQDMIYMAGSACDGFFVLNRQKEVVKRVPLKEHEGAYENY